MRDLVDIFRRPSVETIAQRQLDEARRSLLQAQEALEYAEAQVTFNEQKIARLTRLVRAQEPRHE
jgi:predicted CoA-binding protein